MDFLEQREISGLKQDARNGSAKLEAEKLEYEIKLKERLGEEIKDVLEHPERYKDQAKYARKAEKKKKRSALKDNLKKIFGFKKETEEYF